MRGATSIGSLVLLHLGTCGVNGFSTSPVSNQLRIPAKTAFESSSSLALSAASSAGDAKSGSSELSAAEKKKEDRKIKVREEGGFFAFDTKYGALNPFAIYYGLVAIFLGIPWVATLNLYRLFQSITGGRFDKQVRKSRISQ